MTLDPLFAVRVLADPAGWWTAWVPLFASLGGVVIGGMVTYFATARMESQREALETRQLALSIAAEVKAGLEAFEMSRQAAIKNGNPYNLDTLRYAEIPSDYAPITREAAKRAGRFPVPVAENLARFLTAMANMKQGQDVIRIMHRAGVLSEEKCNQRVVALGAMAETLPIHANQLVKQIARYFPSS